MFHILIYYQDHSHSGGIFQRSVSIQTLDMLSVNQRADTETGHVTIDLTNTNTLAKAEESTKYKQVTIGPKKSLKILFSRIILFQLIAGSEQ